MNFLSVGADKSPLIEYIDFSKKTLILDDGPFIDSLSIPKRRKVVRFDVGEHHFNPLKGMDYQKARELIAVLDAVFPEGDTTLTKENARFEILTALLGKVSTLDKLIEEPFDKKETGKLKAYQMIQTMMMSPVLSSVFSGQINFSLNGIVLARLDRAALGDFDAFVLGNLLISLFKGQVVVPDFGFYGREHHVSLIREERLIAGVTTLSRVARVAPDLHDELLTIPSKKGARTTYKDAVTLANYLCNKAPGSNGYDEFIAGLMA